PYEVDYYFPRRRRLEIMIANRRRRVYNYYRKPRTRKLQSYLLGQKFGTLIRSARFFQAGRLVFISRPIRRNSNTTHRARIYKPLDLSFLRRPQQVPGSIDIATVQLPRISRPQSVIRGQVKHQSTACHRTLERSLVTQIAENRFYF